MLCRRHRGGEGAPQGVQAPCLLRILLLLPGTRTTPPAARSSNVATLPLGAAPTLPSSSRRHPSAVSKIAKPARYLFLKSIDASASIKNGDLLYAYLDDVIQEVGEDNVVQVISDNASNYKNAGSKLMERKENVWWTPCAAHCID
ncbi:uncharacterized protein [Malus domestica]|uniref:uncharacterized protein n=1 Tax=Malus domestica TaxID=3750 RepID=UPI0010AB0544|nr:uncharacterized protein LOC114825156 [Malus domestica]